MCLPYPWILVLMIFVATCCSRIDGFWFFSCPHGNGKGQAGDVCSAFCRCHPLNTCEAGIQKCAAPGVYGDRCHVTRPCASGFSCHPGVQKCFHEPRLHGEPCVAGYDCGGGLSCEPGVQLCFHHPRRFEEPCSAGFSCAPGLSCQPGYQKCLHHPRRENERCSAGYTCADGLVCRLCDKPYATCQMSRVPAFTEQDYDRPFNKVAFLVTHNSFSNSANFAVWARNQRFSVSQQLKDGVRGLMLDIYPGWGAAEVRLCHASCFWSGSSNLLDTLIEIRKFLESYRREVITIIFEDYLKNPTILKRVFDQARISSHVLLKSNYGDGFHDWPTLRDMHRLGRLVVFNNNGLSGFPYTESNMWHYVRENRYGGPGQNAKECVDRAESRWNAAWNDRWSLVLVNWFSTAANPLQPCLNSYKEIRKKLATCEVKFGLWANFIAVNFYTAGSGGGAFQAVRWLNDMLKRNKQFVKERKASIIPFPSTDTVSDLNVTNQRSLLEPIEKQNTSDGVGYGRGFHDLSDIISHVLKHHRNSWVKEKNLFQKLGSTSNASSLGVTAHTILPSQFSQRNKHRKVQIIHHANQAILPDFVRHDTIPTSHDQFSNRKTEKIHNMKKFSQRKVSRSRNNSSHFKKGISHFIHAVKSSKLTNRLSKNRLSLSIKSIKDQRQKIPKERLRKSSRLHKESGRVLAQTVTKATQNPYLPTARLSPRTHRHNKIGTRISPTTKLRNLRRQLARLKAKLNRYLHHGKEKFSNFMSPTKNQNPKTRVSIEKLSEHTFTEKTKQT